MIILKLFWFKKIEQWMSELQLRGSRNQEKREK